MGARFASWSISDHQMDIVLSRQAGGRSNHAKNASHSNRTIDASKRNKHSRIRNAWLHSPYEYAVLAQRVRSLQAIRTRRCQPHRCGGRHFGPRPGVRAQVEFALFNEIRVRPSGRGGECRSLGRRTCAFAARRRAHHAEGKSLHPRRPRSHRHGG